jgi:hypothetical protein
MEEFVFDGWEPFPEIWCYAIARMEKKAADNASAQPIRQCQLLSGVLHEAASLPVHPLLHLRHPRLLHAADVDSAVVEAVLDVEMTGGNRRKITKSP